MNFKSFSATEDAAFETNAVRLYHDLQKEILTGKLPPGTRLVRRELGKRFNLSQSTVSEALWRLESDGLVESAPMYGTRVCHMTMDRVRNELVLREALECEVARLATETILPKHEQPLLDLAAEVDEAMREGSDTPADQGMEIHRAFHMELTQVTGYELLVREVDLIWRRHFVLFNWISAHVLQCPPTGTERCLRKYSPATQTAPNEPCEPTFAMARPSSWRSWPKSTASRSTATDPSAHLDSSPGRECTSRLILVLDDHF